MSSPSHEYSYEELTRALNQSRDLGFVSPQDIDSQIQHSLDFSTLLPDVSGQILDLGSGGGLPGLVVLHANNNAQVTALDAMTKRCEFLETIRESNDSLLERMRVINGRAEELAHKDKFDALFELVIARGFGSPAVTAECAVRYLVTGGKLVVSGRPEDEEKRWNKEKLHELGMKFIDVFSKGSTHVAIMEKVDSTPDQYPRTAKEIKKSPLW